LDYDTSLPVFVHMTKGRQHESKVTSVTLFPVGSVVVMDRAYVKYDYLNNLDSNGIYFVTRLKRNADIEMVESFLTNKKQDHILSDEDIRLSGFYPSQKYPGTLRVERCTMKKRTNIFFSLRTTYLGQQTPYHSFIEPDGI